MTTFNLRTVRLRPGQQSRETLPVTLEPLDLGGQRYRPVPESPRVELTISSVSSGSLFELRFDARLEGPCVRCLETADVPLSISAREYQASSPAGSEELSTPYVEDDRLDLSSWARDAIALELPEKVLCREDCAGLCAGCGADLNRAPCACEPIQSESRFAKLAELRDLL
jgi:uncharacterized protein